MEKKGFYIPCENCGKIIYKSPYQFKRRRHHFCSNKCQAELKHKQVFEYRECEVCGKSFCVAKRLNQRFCSTNCQNEWQKTNTGIANPKFQGELVECEVCGKKHFVGKYRMEHTPHHFCSSECRQIWFATTYSQTEEFKRESSERAVKFLKNNKAVTLTEPQKIVNSLLDSMNINYENEKGFVYYSVDNYLPDFNLVIEVMGDYWHTSPLRYNEPKNDAQKRAISRDKAKHTFLANKYKIEILYLWEKDIRNNLNLCKALIKEYISDGGILENYHSFNYNLNNNNVVLKDNIVKAYQDNVAAS